MEIMSFGGGIQTVAMALMSLHGDLPMPDYAIFADPGWEHEGTYSYLKWFIPYCEKHGMRFRVVSGGDIRKDALNVDRRWASMPLFTIDEENKKGMLRRQCTPEYKVRPVLKEVRNLMGLRPHQRTKISANIWLGISINEASRIKPSRVGYAKNVYPLIKHEISRNNCITYIQKKGFDLPPKSACIGCPYHSDSFWNDLKAKSAKMFQEACDFDEKVRNNSRKGVKNPMFLHRSCKPLKEVDFTHGHKDLFEEECEGYCGL